MTTAFQADAFQTDALAFQIDVAVITPPTTEPNGVGGGVKKRRKRKRRRFDEHTFDGLDFGGSLTPLEDDSEDGATAEAIAAPQAAKATTAYQSSPVRTLMDRTADLIEAARLRKLTEEEEDEDMLLLLSH